MYGVALVSPRVKNLAYIIVRWLVPTRPVRAHQRHSCSPGRRLTTTICAHQAGACPPAPFVLTNTTRAHQGRSCSPARSAESDNVPGRAFHPYGPNRSPLSHTNRPHPCSQFFHRAPSRATNPTTGVPQGISALNYARLQRQRRNSDQLIKDALELTFCDGHTS